MKRYLLPSVLCLVLLAVVPSLGRSPFRRLPALTNSTLTFTQVNESTAHSLRLYDNGDGTYNLGVTQSSPSGAAGRLLSALTSESLLIGSTISTAETAFANTTYTIPANSVSVGDKFVLRWTGRRTTSGSGGPTITLKIELGGVGGTTLLTTGAIPTGLSALTDAYLEGRAFFTIKATGASGSVWCGGTCYQETGALASAANPFIFPMGNGTDGGQNAVVGSLDFTKNEDLVFTITFSANTSGNQVGISEYSLEKVPN